VPDRCARLPQNPEPAAIVTVLVRNARRLMIDGYGTPGSRPKSAGVARSCSIIRRVAAGHGMADAADAVRRATLLAPGLEDRWRCVRHLRSCC
jgi:hypothetical protein